MIDLQSMEWDVLLGFLMAIMAVIGGSAWYLRRIQLSEQQRQRINSECSDESEEEDVLPKKGADKNISFKKRNRNDQWKKKEEKFAHAWLVTTLKGHSTEVTSMDFSSDGKRLVSVSPDRCVYIWNVKDFAEKEHKSVRNVLEKDTASMVAFAPDCKSIVFSMKRENKLSVYRINKTTSASGASSVKLSEVENVTFPPKHTLDISAMGIASTGKFLMSASSDMKIVIYELSGENIPGLSLIETKSLVPAVQVDPMAVFCNSGSGVAKILEPKVSALFDCVLSPDGRFVAVCGFTPDVFVYEVKIDKQGHVVDAKKAFDLKGHSSGVFTMAFNSSGTRAATVSRDGFWRVFDTEIRYAQGQDATILKKGEWSLLKGAAPDSVRVALSPSGGTLAISYAQDIRLFSAEDDTKDFPILSCVHDSRIAALRFSPCGQFLLSTGDKFIRVFHNVPEHHSTIIRLTKQLPEVSGEAAKRRMQEQIEAAKEELSKFE